MLINYIPLFLREIDEFNKLFPSLDTELSKINAFLSELLNGQFIFLCEEEYLQKFEKILSIKPIDSDIEKRRKNIIIKFNEKLPYTVFRFKESLDLILGKNNHFLFIIYDKYRLVLRIKLSDEDDFSLCVSLIDRMLPANMIWEIQKFNNHEIVGKFKHNRLKKYTHREIYTEIL